MTPELRQLAWTAGLTALGLVLLYLLRPRRRRVEVPFGGLWQRVLQESTGATLGRQWRRWLSFLLMFLIGALVVLALGEPLWRRAQVAPGPPPPVPHVVLILDRSASMATRDGDGPVLADGLPPSRLDEAIRRTRALVTAAPADSRFLLLAASGHATVQAGWGSDRKVLHDALAALQPTDGGLDLARARGVAREALAGRDMPHMLLVSDGGPALAELPVEATPVLEQLRVGPGRTMAKGDAARHVPVDDLAVLEVRVRPNAGDADRGTLTVQVGNASQHPVAAQLVLAASASARTSADFAADSALQRVAFVELPPGPSSHEIAGVDLGAARLAVRVRSREPKFRDRAAYDDVGYAVLAERRELHVLLVADADPEAPGAQPNLFLSGALHAIDRVKIHELAPSEYRPEAYRAADRARHGIDIVVLDQVTAPLPDGMPGLALRLQPSAAEAKRAMLHGPEVVIRAGDHPLMNGASFQDTNFDTVRVIKPGPGDIVLAAARPNGPIMVAHQGAARSVEWGVDLTETDLSARYALPLLIANTITWLAGEEQPLVAPLELGRPWAIEVPAHGLQWTWQAPGQAPRPARSSGSQLLASSEIQGIHVWSAPDAREIARPTALPPAENPAAMQPMSAAWRDLPQRPIVDSSGDRPVWAFLLLGALALLAVEWLAYLRRRTV